MTPPTERHPNKQEFSGVLCPLGVASRKGASGSRGHKILILPSAAKQVLSDLIGMGINFGESSHNPASKCGVITSAEVTERKIFVAGYLYIRDCPVVSTITASAEELGMSVEMADAQIEDIRADVWVLNKIRFTGAAIIKESKCAFAGTKVEIANGTN